MGDTKVLDAAARIRARKLLLGFAQGCGWPAGRVDAEMARVAPTRPHDVGEWWDRVIDNVLSDRAREHSREHGLRLLQGGRRG